MFLIGKNKHYLCVLIKIISHATLCSKADIELKSDLINEIIFFIDEHFSENTSCKTGRF